MTVTASGNCTGTYSLTGYVVAGGWIEQSDGQTGSPLLVGGIEPTGATFTGNFDPSSCPHPVYTGTLARR